MQSDYNKLWSSGQEVGANLSSNPNGQKELGGILEEHRQDRFGVAD